MNKIYIVHGWTYNKTKWAPLADRLTKQGLNVNILDIPGLTAPIDTPWTIDDYISWLWRIVHKEKDTIVLIGGSNGGRISLHFCLRYPQLVKHLILIDSAGIYRTDFLYRAKITFFRTLTCVGKRFIDLPSLQLLLYRILKEKDYVQASKTMKITLSNLLASDAHLDMTRIVTPTTIIWGKSDTTTPVWMGQKMHNLIPNSIFHVINNARHAPQYTHVEQVATIVQSVITKTPRVET